MRLVTPGRTYALRLRFEQETLELVIPVTELGCIDLAPAEPAPASRVTTCVADTPEGALATQVPDPGPALDRAGR